MSFTTKLARSTSDSQLKSSVIPPHHKLSYTTKLQSAQKVVRRKSPFLPAASENFIVQKIKQSKARNLRSLNKLLDSLPNKFSLDEASLAEITQSEPFASRERLNWQLAKSLRILKELAGVIEYNFDLTENQAPSLLDQFVKALTSHAQSTEDDVVKHLRLRSTGACALCGCGCKQQSASSKVLDLTEFCIEDRCRSCGMKFLAKKATGICRQCEIAPEAHPCEDGTLNLLLQVSSASVSCTPKPSPLRSRMRGLSGLSDKRDWVPKTPELIKNENCRLSIGDQSVTLNGQGPHIVKLQIRQVVRTSAPSTPSFNTSPSQFKDMSSPSSGVHGLMEVSFSEAHFGTENSEDIGDPGRQLAELSHDIRAVKSRAAAVYTDLQNTAREQLEACTQGLRALDICQNFTGQYSRCQRGLLRVTGAVSNELARSFNLLFDGMVLLVDYALAASPHSPPRRISVREEERKTSI
jgi:hypothetical protein